MHPAISILITLCCLGAVMLTASMGVKSGRLTAETARKTVHVGMGMVCLTFPWIFNSVLAVQAMAAIAILTLLVVRVSKLRSSLGSALFSVERLSVGELLFPLAVAWLFTLGHDKPVIYAVSLLLLTLADTAGALAGSKYGKKIYHTTAATKSLEGSLAFLVTAFLCIGLPLHFFTQLPPGLVLFLALTVALFTMAVEGASGHGLDNLLIPLGSFLLLDHYTGLGQHAIFQRSVVLLFLLALLLATHRNHTFDGGAILTAMLFGFATFTLGGLPCLLAALIVFIRHMFTQHRMPKQHLVTHSIDCIIAIAIPSLAWLTLGRGNVISYETSRLGFICTMSLVIYLLHTGTQKHMRRDTPSLPKGFALSVLVLLPALALDVPPVHFLPALCLGMPLARFYFFWKLGPDDDVASHWLQFGVLATVSSALVMLPSIL